MAGELNPAAATAGVTGSPTRGNPSLVPKRQRRPSVRLGDIGGETFTKPSSSSSKSRPLTNLLVNNNQHYFKSSKRPRTNFTRKDDQDGIYHNNNNNNNNNTEFNYQEEEEEQQVDEQDEDEEEDIEQRSPLTGHSGDDVFFQGWPPNTNTNTNSKASDLGCRQLDVGVRKWLLHLGLSRYSPLFLIHEVDDDVLPHLTLDDLKDMGIIAVGSRRKLYTAILNLRKGLS